MRPLGPRLQALAADFGAFRVEAQNERKARREAETAALAERSTSASESMARTGQEQFAFSRRAAYGGWVVSAVMVLIALLGFLTNVLRIHP